MFDYISGKLSRKGENFIVIDVGGIGYKIYCSASCASAVEDRCKMYIYMHIREDLQELYGFSTMTERETFEKLISVSGVGCKVALGILSNITPHDLALAIVTNDSKMITVAPGVGAKLAQRIILELKDKVKNKDFEFDNGAGSAAFGADMRNEAVSALVALGYSAGDAARAIKNVDSELTLEDTIKEVLRKMSKFS